MTLGNSEQHNPTAERRKPTRSALWQFRVAWAFTVVPVWIAAWRVAASGFYPTGDAGLTVLRARDVLTAHPPLVGMPAASASVTDAMTFFPGPLQLYVLAVPVKLFGNVWGPPFAMAALATLWITLAAWVLWRSLGPRQALAGLALMTVFAWAIGIGYLVEPVPIMMMIFPLVPLLLVVSCTISGDRVALVATMVIGNFLWLDHLVFVVAVPVLVACGLIGYVVAYRGRWWDRSDGNRTEHLRAWRGLITALVVSLVMWLPTLIAEVTRSPGNLQLLVGNSGAERESIGSLPFAFHFVVGLVAWPPFWWRGSFWDAPFVNQPGPVEFAGSPAGYDVVAGLLLVGLFIVLGVAARRDGDRFALWLLVVAAVAMGAAIPTVYFTPTQFGIAGYLRPLWGVAAFVWFALAVAGTRLLLRRPIGRRIRTPALWSVGALVVVFGLLNVPTSPYGYVPDRDLSTRVDLMNEKVLAHVGTTEPLALWTRPDYSTQSYFGALVLALRTAGVDFCVARGSPPLAGVDSCDGHGRRVISIAVRRDAPDDRSDVIISLPIISHQDQRRLSELDREVTAWLEDDTPIEVTRSAWRAADAIVDPTARAHMADLLGFTDPSRPVADRKEALRAVIGLWFAVPEFRDVRLLVSSPMTMEELHEWQELQGGRGSVVVTDEGIPAD